MKKLLIAAVASIAVSSGAFALTASDNSGNYSGTFIGLNQGTGFNAWSGSATGGGGNYIGGSGLSASSWAIYSGGGAGNSYQATRPFSTAMSIGDIFTLQLGYTGVSNGGEIGINLFSGGSFRLGFKFIGGSSGWVLNDGGSDFSSGISWAGGTPGATLNYSFTRGTGNAYSLNISQGTQSYTGNNTGTSGIMSIDSVQFYSSAQGGGENIGFNNLSVVPEPSTYALLALAAAGFGAHVIRRRRRA